MKYKYDRVLSKDEIFVGLIDMQGYYPTLSNTLKITSNKYGFTFKELLSYDQIETLNLKKYLLSHLIVVDGIDSLNETMVKYESLLGNISSLTLAHSYSSIEAFEDGGNVIPRLKSSHRNVNFLLPVRCENGAYRPPFDKLIDNSICDTKRIKYKAKQVANEVNFSNSTKLFFQKMSRLIESENLYHRASTDGFISLRNPNGGFYITATKTNKISLDMSRIVLVHSYDRKNNQIEYSGPFLPSSDCVEVSVLYDKLPEINAVLHSHASIQFTRNPLFEKNIGIPPSKYGVPELGDKIVKYFDEFPDQDFTIMEDHGEVFLGYGNSPHECYDFIENTINRELIKYYRFQELGQSSLNRIFDITSKEKVKEQVLRSGLNIKEHNSTLSLHIYNFI